MAPDFILHNANILTMTEPGAQAQALAVRDGKIVAIGSDRDILLLAEAQTRIRNLNGTTILPGFVESHMHLFSGALSRKVLQLHGVMGEAALREAVQDFAAANPDEPLLIAQGWQYGGLGEGHDLDRHVLDLMCPDRPIVVQSSDFHNAWCNTTALDAAGILNGREVGPGAEVVLGADGLASGVLIEPGAVAPVLALGRHGGRESLGLHGREPSVLTQQQRDDDKTLLREGLAYCASQGITTIVNMDGNRYQADLLGEIEQDGDLVCRVDLPFHFTPAHSVSDLAIAEAMRRDLNSDMLWCNRIKFFVDGVLDMRTAYRLSDYPGRPGERGAPLFPHEVFNEIAVEVDRRGFQIAVHAIGDAAVRMVLDGYGEARTRNGGRDARHRVEHCELTHPDDRRRMAVLGAIASMQPPHPPGCGDFPLEPTVSTIGHDDWPNAYAWRDLKAAGVEICFSSDWPVAALPPLAGVGFALSRVPWSDDLPDQRLGFYETLHAYTAGGAHAVHCEKRFGRIVPGMAADIVVLDRVLTPENVAEAQIALTICAGRITYDATSDGLPVDPRKE